MLRRVLGILGSIPFFVSVALALVVVLVVGSLGVQWLYRHPLFMVLGGLLEVSLILCVVPRSLRRIRGWKRAARSEAQTLPGGAYAWPRTLAFLRAVAADVIHLGLLVVIAGGVVSYALREEASYVGSPGTELVHDGLRIAIGEAREIRDSRGVLRNWNVILGIEGREVELAANRPARAEGLRFHLRTFQEEDLVSVTSDGNLERTLRVGDGLVGQETALLFAGAQGENALFAVVTNQEVLVSVAPGERIGPLRVVGVDRNTIVGYSITRDPGRVPLMAGFALIATGLLLYGWKRWRSRG